MISFDEKDFEVCYMTSMTFSAFILLFFRIDIGYTFKMIESHFQIRAMGSDHLLVRKIGIIFKNSSSLNRKMFLTTKNFH
jgi:hypothetical protein